MEIYVEKWFFPLKTKEFLFTGVVEKFKLFPQGGILIKFQKVFHNFSFHIPQPLWKNQRQELILAVMSRIWFCRAVSLLKTADSTFLMEYKMVV